MEEYNNISYTIRTDENDPTGEIVKKYTKAIMKKLILYLKFLAKMIKAL